MIGLSMRFVLSSCLCVLILGDQVFAQEPTVVKISAKQYEYTPAHITLKKDVPVVIQLTTEDRSHGFSVPEWKVRQSIEPGKVVEVQVTPDKIGEVPFYCDIYCGAGHEDMEGTFKVVE